MRKKLLLLVGAALVLSGCSLPSFMQKKAGLKVGITDNVPTSISLNGIAAGQAPYSSDNLKPGSYTIKLTPQDSTKPPYETTIALNSGLVTVMTWSFGKTADESGGEIFELSGASGGKTELSIVTNPDNIIVKVDGQSKGFSPLILGDLSEGSHTLTLSAPGYVERTSNPSLVKGYRVTVTSKLGREPETSGTTAPSASVSATPTPVPTVSPSPSPKVTPKPSPKVSPSPSPKASSGTSPSPSPSASTQSTTDSSGVIRTTITPPTPYVEITSSTAGADWLRVHSAPGISDDIAHVGVGSKFPFKQTTNGWHEIEYQTGKTGWVSGQYSTVHN